MTKATLKPRKCSKCGGVSLYDKDEGCFRCENCGHEQRTRLEYQVFLESHKREILRDFATLGWTLTLYKWDMCYWTWNSIRGRWGLKKIWCVPDMLSFSKDGLPKLPAWRQDWPLEFKVTWLETYKILAESRRGSESNGNRKNAGGASALGSSRINDR